MSDLLSIAEVAALLKCSPETAARRFAREKGVIDLSASGNTRKRRYRVLRIPRTVVEKWIAQRGGRIQVDVPQKPVMSKPTTVTEDALTHDLALLAAQRGEAADATLRRIARRARAMTFVRPEDWERMVWLDEED